MLSPADVLNLIRLTELELDKIHENLESDKDPIKNEAGEMSVQMDKLAQKLKKMYCDIRPDDSELPSYDEYMSILESKKLTR